MLKVTSKYFDLGISAVIGLNVITMAMEFYMMPPVKRTNKFSINLKTFLQELNQALKLFNYFFTTTFCLEAMLKVVALGPERYFSEKWNQLDMAIVALSVLGITLEEIEVEQKMSLLTQYILSRVLYFPSIRLLFV